MVEGPALDVCVNILIYPSMVQAIKCMSILYRVVNIEMYCVMSFSNKISPKVWELSTLIKDKVNLKRGVVS